MKCNGQFGVKQLAERVMIHILCKNSRFYLLQDTHGIFSIGYICGLFIQEIYVCSRYYFQN